MSKLDSLYFLPFQQKDYELEQPQRTAVDYENVYPDSEIPEIVPPNDHPIRLRTKYPGNRDIRSDVPTFEDDADANATLSLPKGGVPSNKLDKEEPLSLWDLEREKEERDAMKKEQNYEMRTNEIEEEQRADVQPQFDDVNIEKKRRRRRRRRQSEESSTESFSGGAEKTDNDEWFLASISSTGVLMKSLNNTRSAIDFAFVLNIRESEAFPPLFLPQDLNCIEEKISAYKSK